MLIIIIILLSHDLWTTLCESKCISRLLVIRTQHNTSTCRHVLTYNTHNMHNVPTESWYFGGANSNIVWKSYYYNIRSSRTRIILFLRCANVTAEIWKRRGFSYNKTRKITKGHGGGGGGGCVKVPRDRIYYVYAIMLYSHRRHMMAGRPARPAHESVPPTSRKMAAATPKQ